MSSPPIHNDAVATTSNVVIQEYSNDTSDTLFTLFHNSFLADWFYVLQSFKLIFQW